MRRLILVAMVMIASLGFGQQAKRPFTFEDMMALKRMGEPVPSPDGKWVAFSAVDVNLEANTRTPHIWVVPLAGGEAKQLFAGGPGEDRPRWSPDGKRLAFLSSRDGGEQVWIAEFDSATGTMGEPKKVTNLSTEVDGQIWSPDLRLGHDGVRHRAPHRARCSTKALTRIHTSKAVPVRWSLKLLIAYHATIIRHSTREAAMGEGEQSLTVTAVKIELVFLCRPKQNQPPGSPAADSLTTSY